jgi:hypothetical protein
VTAVTAVTEVTGNMNSDVYGSEKIAFRSKNESENE